MDGKSPHDLRDGHAAQRCRSHDCCHPNSGRGGDHALAGRERGVAGDECRASGAPRGTRAPAGAEQWQQREAPLQRWVEETATDPESARSLGPATRRAEGPSRQHAASSGRTGRHSRPLPQHLPELRFDPDPSHGHGVQRPAGL